MQEDLSRLVRYIPGVKVVVLVRNPVNRAYSDYVMFSDPPFLHGNGCIDGHGHSFEELVAEELEVRSFRLLTDNALKYPCLMESTRWQTPLLRKFDDFRGRLLRYGEYAHYAEPWMRLLGPDRLLFVKSEDMARRPSEVMRHLLRWAGLRHEPLTMVTSNKADCRGSVAGAEDFQCVELAPPRPAMNGDMRALLAPLFASSNSEFQRLTGVPVEEWGDL